MKFFSFARMVAVFIKEFQQMMRDRLTFGMAVGIPILQLVLFGYAINTDPKGLPTALVAADTSPLAGSIVADAAEHRLFQDRAPGHQRGRRPRSCWNPARCSSSS